MPVVTSELKYDPCYSACDFVISTKQEVLEVVLR